jgi:hypothetical protein
MEIAFFLLLVRYCPLVGIPLLLLMICGWLGDLSNHETSKKENKDEIVDPKPGLPLGIRKIGDKFEAWTCCDFKVKYLGTFNIIEDARR